jgi:multiple sugar transport system permease protein
VKARTGWKVVRTAVAFLVALFFLVPYLEMLLTSLKPQSELFASPQSYLPSRWDFANFVHVWSAAPVADYLRNSLIIACCATVICVLVATPAAYYVARHTFRGRRAFMLLILVTQMLSPTALVIGLFREFVSLNLSDSYIPLILTDAVFNIPFGVWLLSGFFQTVPVALEEAARLDGCSKWGVMRRVVIPLTLPGLVTVVIFTFIAAWNEFIVALTLTTSPDHEPLTVGLQQFVGQYTTQWQYLFAGSLVAIVPVVILFAVIERYVVSGLTAGSVK